MIINLNGGNTEGVTQELTELQARASALEDELTANGTRIYLDYKDGKYGYNTDALRGADTFSPFKSGGSDSVYTNLTTVASITGDKLPTIYGSGYIILKRIGGTVSTTLNVFIDGNVQKFPLYSTVINNNVDGVFWRLYFQESISFSLGNQNDTYFYQTLLADNLVDKKYNITQGVTTNTDYITITGKGKILISFTSLATMRYMLDSDVENRIVSDQYMEFTFENKFVFSATLSTHLLYYIAYIEK